MRWEQYLKICASIFILWTFRKCVIYENFYLHFLLSFCAVSRFLTSLLSFVMQVILNNCSKKEGKLWRIFLGQSSFKTSGISLWRILKLFHPAMSEILTQVYTHKYTPFIARILTDLKLTGRGVKVAPFSWFTTRVNVIVSLKLKLFSVNVNFGSLNVACILPPNLPLAGFSWVNLATPWYNRLSFVNFVPKYNLVSDTTSSWSIFVTVHVISTDPPKTPITGSGVTCKDCPITKTKQIL